MKKNTNVIKTIFEKQSKMLKQDINPKVLVVKEGFKDEFQKELYNLENTDFDPSRQIKKVLGLHVVYDEKEIIHYP